MKQDTKLSQGIRKAPERMPSGVKDFDELVEGGYPAGSLITLVGRPGTGKTIFGSQFLYEGCKEQGEPGMYVSMLENRQTYFRNASRLGFDFESLEKKGLFRFLEMPSTTAEGLSSVWEEIVKRVEEDGTARLVLDSYTAMAQSFTSQGDLRIFTHMLLNKIISGAGCTTLMITELSPGNTSIGSGVEEFIADGVVYFHFVPISGDARIRYIEIMKMRGTNHWMGPIPIEISNRGIVIRHPHIRTSVAESGKSP